MKNDKEKLQLDDLSPILKKYWEEVVEPNFKIGSGNQSGSLSYDSKTFKGQIKLPTSFSFYKRSDYYLNVKDQKYIHFTSLETFFKIINNGYFLATQFSNHDDPMELLFAGNELSEVITKENIDQLKKDVFSLSMCNYLPENESFDMWRIYGNQGYGIGIVFSFFPNEELWINSFLSKVYYENENNCLDKFREFQKDHLDFLRNNPTLEMERNYSGEKGMPDSLALFLAFHKKSHFKIENEVRFLKSFLLGNSGGLDSLDVTNNSIELLINRKNETYFGYRIPIVSENNIDKIAVERELEKIPNFSTAIISDISIIKNHVDTNPFIIIKKVILGYRYTESDLLKFKKMETEIKRKIGACHISFELSGLSKEFNE
ncbi:MAG: DUF2971 domain-containing protein [Ginsengibacter sp.]